MSLAREGRRSLPVLDGHSGRNAMTCLFRCGNACAHPAPNSSDNEYFGDMLQAEVSRRGIVRAAAVGALVIGAGSAIAGAAPAYATGRPSPSPAPSGGDGALTFKPIPPNRLDSLIVPNGYDWSVVAKWGDPILPGAPEFDIDHQSVKAQEGQFGYNNDWLVVLPLDRQRDRALLVVNHEYTNEILMFRDYVDGAPHEGSGPDRAGRARPQRGRAGAQGKHRRVAGG